MGKRVCYVRYSRSDMDERSDTSAIPRRLQVCRTRTRAACRTARRPRRDVLIALLIPVAQPRLRVVPVNLSPASRYWRRPAALLMCRRFPGEVRERFPCYPSARGRRCVEGVTSASASGRKEVRR